MEEREQDGRGAGCSLVGAAFFLLLALYVLGIGPAEWLGNNYPATQNWLCVVYCPLSLAAEIFPPFGEALMWYTDFWV